MGLLRGHLGAIITATASKLMSPIDIKTFIPSVLLFHSVSISPAFSQLTFTMAPEKKLAPYGTWDSPITPEIVSGSSLTFKEVHVNVSQENQYPQYILTQGHRNQPGISMWSNPGLPKRVVVSLWK